MSIGTKIMLAKSVSFSLLFWIIVNHVKLVLEIFNARNVVALWWFCLSPGSILASG
jgi:hypothetical protein